MKGVICTSSTLVLWWSFLTRARADMNIEDTDEIDKKTLEIRPVDDDVYDDLQSLADELPDHAPRFVLLSYPLTLVISPIRLHTSGIVLTPCVIITGLRPPLSPLRHALLPPHHMQRRSQNAVRRRKGIDAEYE